jgi:hypothetical protein
MSNIDINSPIIEKNNLKLFSSIINKKNTPKTNNNKSTESKYILSPKKNTASSSYIINKSPIKPKTTSYIKNSPITPKTTSTKNTTITPKTTPEPSKTTNSNKNTPIKNKIITQGDIVKPIQANNKKISKENIQITANNLKTKNSIIKEAKTDSFLPSINSIKDNINEYIFSKKILYSIIYIFILGILFVILYLLGKYLIKKYLSNNLEVILLKEIKKGNTAYVISQDPLSKSYIQINRSNNISGIQFSYSLWLYIESIEDKKQHIFHKGNIDAYPLMCPAVYLQNNDISVHINTILNIDENITISEIPIHKWLYLTIVVNNKNMDIYINGYLKDRKELSSLPKQNTGNFWCNMNGGFNGFISKIKYYPYSIDLNEIIDNVEDGPGKSSCVTTDNKPPYLNRNWFLL